MPSPEPTYKKPFETISKYEESTWLGNDTAIFENEYTGVFKDKYPCVKGHTLFISLCSYELLSGSVNLPSIQSSQKKRQVLNFRRKSLD